MTLEPDPVNDRELGDDYDRPGFQPLDFKTIALRVLVELDPLSSDADTRLAMAVVVEHLRRVWNSRGAADITALEATFTDQTGTTGAAPYREYFDRTLRALDR